MLGGPAIEQDIDRPDDLSPTVFRLGLSRNDLSLVGIVVQDGAALFEVCEGESPADRLGNAICKAVGVTQAFSLDEFDLLALQRDLVQLLDPDISLH